MLLGAAMMFGAWFAYQRITSQQEQEVTSPEQQAGEQPALPPRPDESSAEISDPQAPPPTRPAPQPEPDSSAEPQRQVQPSAAPSGPRFHHRSFRNEEIVRLGSVDPEQYTFELELSTQGAAIRSLRLAEYFETVNDKRRASPEDDHVEGHYQLLRPIRVENREYLPYATASLRIKPVGGEQTVIRLDTVNWVKTDAPVGDDDSESASFKYELLEDVNYANPDAPADIQPFATIIKTYTVRKDNYSVDMSLDIQKHTNQDVELSIEQYGATGLRREDQRQDRRSAAIGKLRDQAMIVHMKNQSSLKNDTMYRPVEVGWAHETNQNTLWIGVINKYFASMMYIHGPQEGKPVPPQQVRYDVIPVGEDGERTFLASSTITLRPETHTRVDYDIFAGPKRRGLFADNPLYSSLNYISTIEFQSCFCSVDWLSLVMIRLLDIFAALAFNNYGLAIIVLVVLVRLLLHPLTKKSQVLMFKMQKLGPEMERLKKKYADDKEALQRETMNLYKEQGLTPLLGCLPMLLQMPIWIALWGGLNAAVELRHAAFLPFWLTDLAAPDAIISWSRSLPFIGDSLNLLPILVAVAMFFQTKLNPQMSGATPTPQQDQQKKMMTYMMPIMMLFIFYPMPSGLSLYVMTSTFAGVAEQYVIRKHLREKEAQQAATTTTITAPGKPPRAQRPKKPKGPTWFKHS